MGKAAKSKSTEPTPEKGEEGYEFKLPAFDETTFIRREVQAARASFYTLGLGLAAGLLSVLTALLPAPWYVGWIPIFVAMIALRPLLQAMGFSDEVTAWKALFGSFFMMFFTALAVWILGVNLL